MMRGSKVAIILMCSALALVACGKKKADERISFDGHHFNAKAKRVDKKDYGHFTVQVRPVSQSLDGARAAGSHQGVRYCIETYGTSDILWVVGPDTDPASLIISSDTLNFEGNCKQ